MDGIFGSELIKSFAGNLVRHALTLLGGWLVANGYMEHAWDEASVAKFAAGIVAVAISIALAFRKSARNEQKVEAALSLPAGAPREQVEAIVDKKAVVK